jgi:hypothetical protein
MAPRRHRLLLGKRVNFADEILEKLIARTEAECQPAQEIHNFVKDLRNILKLAERAASDVSAGEEHGDMAQILRELQKESEWQQCECTTQCCNVLNDQR